MVTIFNGRVLDGLIVPDKPIDLPNGTSAEVRVSIPEDSNGISLARTSSSEAPSMLELLDTLPLPGLFKTTKEVSQYLREERDSWDS